MGSKIDPPGDPPRTLQKGPKMGSKMGSKIGHFRALFWGVRWGELLHGSGGVRAGDVVESSATARDETVDSVLSRKRSAHRSVGRVAA